ncbi:S8 family serine peptidase [Oscillatoria salina]|uniref:S8 family serine peptidase n=1 Tax=Oscillatoria salina TaxID=331517 RepID=UPI001CCAB62B|nr:S8 family serine peptidase [Oscillatoria salina]MBZ8180401.1 S8 family serine peptidase [Oscillatoria salina IIICB1]
MTQLPGSGVPEASVGIILQRGGEELALSKVSDRFTLSLQPSDGEFPPQIANLPNQQIPRTNLFVVSVAPAELEATMQTARELENVAFASHVYQLANNADARVYLTNEITIQFTPDLDEETKTNLATEFGLQQVKPITGIDNAFVYQLTPAASENPLKIANRLVGKPGILVAEANIILHRESFYRPLDNFYPEQWYLHHEGGYLLDINSHIDAEKAWEITRGVRSIVVAVTDDAFDIDHPDFQGEGKIVAPRDFQGQDFLPLPETDDESHGTACAGVAVAEENGTGVVGVAPGCALMPLRTTGFLDDESIEDLFNWAVEKGASVISCSWGAAAVHFPLSLRQSAAIANAATKGRNGKGCIIVFAAGNANRPTNGTIYERGWVQNVVNGPTQWLSGFAVHPDVITVSASTSLSKKSAYSNWGTNISVCAPSNNAPPGTWFPETGYIFTAPEIRGYLPGRGILTTDLLGQLGYAAGDFTRDFGGTSSATPVVAGLAALVLSVNPDLTAQEVKLILQQTADKIVDQDTDPQLGLRLGTYDKNGHSQWFGYGKVNAFKAVQAAKEKTRLTQTVTRRIRDRNNTSLAIPDNNLQGVTSTIRITEKALLREIQVNVDIEHEFLGDITITLLAPSGEKILLQNRTLGAQTKLKATYFLETAPALKQVLNKSAAGNWRLKVVDFSPEDTGKIKSWELRLGF